MSFPLTSSAALLAVVALAAAAAASFLTSLIVFSRFLSLESRANTLPATPAAAFPPVTFVKNHMKAAKREGLYFISFAVNSSMVMWMCMEIQMHLTIYSTREPFTMKSILLQQMA